MPQIQEYLPETQAQEPVGGSSPNIELAGAVGRGIQNVGNSLEQGGAFIEQRASQEETADVYSAMADKRMEYMNRVQQGIQDGSLDMEQLKQDYDNDTQTIGDNLSTPQGKNYFERQQARVKGAVMAHAQFGMAQIAKNRTIQSYQDGLTKNSNVVEANPDDKNFQDTYENTLETIDQMIKTDGLPEAYRGKAVKEAGAELSRAQIMGMGRVGDPSQVKKLLMGGNGQGGKWDQWLNPEQKQAMFHQLTGMEQAKLVEQARAQRAIDDARAENYRKWGNDHFEALEKNTLSTDDVLKAVKDGTMDWDQGHSWIGMIDHNARQDTKPNPFVLNDLVARATDPTRPDYLASMDDALPYATKVGASGMRQINELINMRTDTKEYVSGYKALMNSAKSTIRFKNMMTNQYDVRGEEQLQSFTQDLNSQIKLKRARGEDPNDLFNPQSPDYFGNQIKKYQTSMSDQLNNQQQERTDKAIGLKPTGNNPNPTPNPRARKPNESPTDYLNRMKSVAGN